jgi:hypothetical protein
MYQKVLFFFISLQLFIPLPLRKPNFVSWMQKRLGYINPLNDFRDIAEIANNFYYFENTINDFVHYNGQTMVLESLLTILFTNNFGECEITIEDAVRTEPLYFHNKSEPFDAVYMMNVDDEWEGIPVHGDPQYIGNMEEFEAEADFIVRVHKEAVTDIEEAYLRSIVDKFKIAGKNYLVLALEP